ncbi:MAG: ribose-phosphate pyrophosphokinase [Rhodothermales bacterium]|nr:ribose-phosphate pyrophosphokinase [Rhodothermales bacterium]MCA0268880.1 ribose-phosphate pyrophosphokinase [Bacteroidota bacterium]
MPPAYDPRPESPIALFAGRSNPGLAKGIAEAFGSRLGQIKIKDFSDGELYVHYDESIRGADLYLIQSTCPPADNWLELLLLIDAARRASASRITAVMPYFGYARQERKDQPRVSIAAKLMANLLTTAGVDRVLTMDLHAPQIQGFFDVPVDHLYASGLFVEHLRTIGLQDNLVVVAPDVGAIKAARSYAKRLGTDLAVIDKRRPTQNESEVVNIIGDVAGRNVLLIDDIVDTAGTITNAAGALKQAGALDIVACCTHPLLSGPAYERIENSAISRFIVTDSIPLRQESSRIEVVSVAPLFADAIHRIYEDKSISTLFAE